MPAYDFICESCGHKWEDIIPYTQLAATEKGPCPECKKRTVRREFLAAPMIKTSTTFLASHGTLLDHFGDTPEGRSQLNHRVAVARAHGYNPNMHDVYDETAALFPGDPGGFLPHDNPLSQQRTRKEEIAKRIIEEREAPALADDLAEEFASDALKENPDLAAKPKNEVLEMVRDKHSY